MPWASPKICSKVGCGAFTRERFCADHKNADKRAIDRRRGSASKRGYGARWRQLRKMILARDPVCQAEGCGEPSTDVDHIKPRRDGGTNDPANLQGLCHECHSRKTAHEVGWGDRGSNP